MGWMDVKVEVEVEVEVNIDGAVPVEGKKYVPQPATTRTFTIPGPPLIPPTYPCTLRNCACQSYKDPQHLYPYCLYASDPPWKSEDKY